jgi:outer membrane protein assembly factor BamB
LFQNLILYGSGNCFYAVDLKSGSLKWWFKAEGAVHTKPAIASNIVYFGSFGGYVYALDAITGRAIWEFKTTGHTYFPAGEVTGNPVVLDGKVFVGARDYNFYALDAQGGYCHWLQQFPRGWALPVTIADSVVLLGTSDDRALLALDPASGNERWRINTGFNVFGACAVANGVGYVGTLAGRLIAFDVKSGKTHWEFETGARQRNHNKFLTNGDAYRDDIGALLKSSSDVLRMYQALGGIFSTPVISDDKLVVSCYDGSVYCLPLH